VTERATGPGCIIQSNFGGGDHGNFEVVVLEGSDLVHYWHDNSTDLSTPWIRSPHTITTSATGPGCMIQSDFGDGDHGNFEVVVLEGNDLVHYWHDNSDVDNLWAGGTTITSHAISGGRLIQGDYFQNGRPLFPLFGNGHANFELVVLEGDDGLQGRGLIHYARDNSGAPWAWSATPTLITADASEAAALFQSDYSDDGHGNFELIVNNRGALTHWIRDNSAAGLPWISRGQISAAQDNASGPASAFQSNYGSDDDHGDYEVVVPVGGQIVYYRRDAAQGKWFRGGTISPKSFTFRSDFNRWLPTLQFRKQVDGVDFWYGRGDASAAVSGLVAGGTQDNGVLYCRGGRHLIPWREFREADGHAACFLPARSPVSDTLPSGWVLAWNDNSGDGMVMARSWDAATSRLKSYAPDPGVIPVSSPQRQGLRDPRIEVVVSPQFPSAKRLLCAVAAKDSDIFGLFAGDVPAEDPTQPELHWERITTLPGRSITPDTRVTALGAYDGREILVAARTSGRAGMTNVPEFFHVDVASGNATQMAVDPAVGTPEPTAIAPISADRAYAATSDGRVLVWDGRQWEATTSQPAANGRLVAMAADRSSRPPVMFVASDRRVFVSRDQGASWPDASDGLPKAIACADLRLVEEGEGVHLYLWSFGRSLWFVNRPGDGW
jgi:hypothetical protein